jgi:hypothetical protein
MDGRNAQIAVIRRPRSEPAQIDPFRSSQRAVELVGPKWSSPVRDLRPVPRSTLPFAEDHRLYPANAGFSPRAVQGRHMAVLAGRR